MIDSAFMQPSTLAPAEQQRMRARFASLRQPHGVTTPYRLELRACKIGPNTFALPHGVIIMTDEMVRETANDDAIMGVLAHELGHVQRHHATRHVLQTLGAGLLLNLWVGDVSSALVAAPLLLLEQNAARACAKPRGWRTWLLVTSPSRPAPPANAVRSSRTLR